MSLRIRFWKIQSLYWKQIKFNIIENRLAQRLEIQDHDPSWYWSDIDLVLILTLVWYWLWYRFGIDQDLVWPDLFLISSPQGKKSFVAILQRVHSAKLVLQRVYSTKQEVYREFTAQNVVYSEFTEQKRGYWSGIDLGQEAEDRGRCQSCDCAFVLICWILIPAWLTAPRMWWSISLDVLHLWMGLLPFAAFWVFFSESICPMSLSKSWHNHACLWLRHHRIMQLTITCTSSRRWLWKKHAACVKL